MKINEILLIGGALLAALVLSKGRAASSVLQNITLPLLPDQNQNQKEITTIIVKPPQYTKIDITEQLRNISSLELEKNLTPLQNQINESQKYISTQEKFKPNPQFTNISPINWSAKDLLGKFDSTFDYYSKVWTGEKGPLSGISIFPDFNLSLSQGNRSIISNQLQYETAQENIGKANEMITRQQGEIDLINEEYQTRFGGLSRYG
jgi:hypothetical protein